MRNFFLVIFCLFIVIVQVSSAGVFFGPERTPNLVMALVVSLTLILGFEKSLAWIFLAGIFADAYTGWAFGTSTIILVLIAWVTSGLLSVANIRSRRLLFFPSLFFLAAGFAVVHDFLAGIAWRADVLWLGSGNARFGTEFFGWNYVLKIIFTALSIYAIYYFVAKINKFFSRPASSFVKK